VAHKNGYLLAPLVGEDGFRSKYIFAWNHIY
jgi:hypothetical protein